MANHPNRNWRNRWIVDPQTQTATHKDGWTIFFPDGAQNERPQGVVLKQQPIETLKQLRDAGRIRIEAGKIYYE